MQLVQRPGKPAVRQPHGKILPALAARPQCGLAARAGIEWLLILTPVHANPGRCPGLSWVAPSGQRRKLGTVPQTDRGRFSFGRDLLARLGAVATARGAWLRRAGGVLVFLLVPTRSRNRCGTTSSRVSTGWKATSVLTSAGRDRKSVV